MNSTWMLGITLKDSLAVLTGPASLWPNGIPPGMPILIVPAVPAFSDVSGKGFREVLAKLPSIRVNNLPSEIAWSMFSVIETRPMPCWTSVFKNSGVAHRFRDL
jgi:hypothetical protein